ncbi:MAG: thiol reductant ABC exporter subunit CydD [Candidatus Nanopelagicales bacterium]|nr:thiol reductant ABC exporter subunit CydD [Candidatus Nanopelagicales bacterium]
MKPVDPRLFRYARSTRVFMLFAIILGTLTAVLVIGQAWFLSRVIVGVTANNEVLADVSFGVAALAGVFAARSLLAWGAEVVSVRASGEAKAQLRQAAMSAVIDSGTPQVSPGDIAVIATRGIDALDTYFARYLPQLVLAVIVPISVLAVIFTQDILSAIIVAVTIPLIPIFMILIGLFTKNKVDRQWSTLSTLSGHFLDLVSGLPTLKVFGRAQAQVTVIKRVGEEYRSSTMGVLRISFLSSLALELLATLSVALVAVSIGLRLAEAQIDYRVGLFVLLLAPEVYLPLRLIGQHFHAAAEGLGAADKLFSIIENQPAVAGGTTDMPADITVSVSDLSVQYPDTESVALAPVSLTATPGSITAIVGHSGSGKTTLLRALGGLVHATSGDISVGGVLLTTINMTHWRASMSWLPQHAQLFAQDLNAHPTIRSVVDLHADHTDSEIWNALSEAEVAAEIRPLGLDFTLDAQGSGLSGGQLQRLAIARALITQPKIFLLDEPTAALDSASEIAIADVLQGCAARGMTVILVAHRPALMEIAHQVVRVESGHSSTQAPDADTNMNTATDMNTVIPTGSRGW